MNRPLENQSSQPQKGTALITGASTGIGKDLAKIFAKNGHDLVLVARSKNRLEELQKEIATDFGRKVLIYACDLSLIGSATELFNWTKREKLDIEILVNNAGVGLVGEFGQSDLQSQIQMIQLNVTTLTELTGLFLPAMLKNRRGRILNVASTAAFQPGPLMSVYYATKSFVLSFSEGLARELKDSGVTLTCLCPGPTETEFQQKAKIDLKKMLKGVPVATSYQVAFDGYNALMSGQVIKISGFVNSILVQGLRFAPRNLVRNIIYKMQNVRQNV